MREFATVGLLCYLVTSSALPAAASLVPAAAAQAVYDTDKDVTWVADANLAATQTFGVRGINPDGSMSWEVAKRWVAAMNAAHYLGSDRWNLPATQLPDERCSQRPAAAAFGYGCVGSQLGYLYYDELGGVNGSTIGLTHNASYALFRNFQPYLYWSGTLWERVPNSAFSFSFGNGFQGTNVFANAMYVLAVAPGRLAGP